MIVILMTIVYTKLSFKPYFVLITNVSFHEETPLHVCVFSHCATTRVASFIN